MSFGLYVTRTPECRWVKEGWVRERILERKDLVRETREEIMAWFKAALTHPGANYTVKEYMP